MGGGGGSGSGGGSAPDMNDLDDEGTDSDDEPMPDLEDVPKTEDEKAKSNSTNEETKWMNTFYYITHTHFCICAFEKSLSNNCAVLYLP